MNLRRIISTDITVSAIVHLSLLTLLLLFSEVREFGSVTAETIAVDIVAPQEIPAEPTEEKQEKPPEPAPALDFSVLDSKPATPSLAPPAAKSPAAARQQKQAALAPPPAAAKPQPSAQPGQSGLPAYRPPRA